MQTQTTTVATTSIDQDSQDVATLRRQLDVIQAAFVSATMEKNFLQRAVADLNFHHNAHDGIVYTDAQHRVVYANPYFLKMMNIGDPADLLNKPLPDYMWSDPGDATQLFEDVQSNGFVRERDLSLYNQDKSPIFVACSSVASRDADGQFIGTEIMLCNVTSKRKIQSELAQRTQTLTRVAALSHESLTHLEEIVKHGADSVEILTLIGEIQQRLDQALNPDQP
jgi:PAS domain-containing protein